jgi:hypothetical protein
MDSTDETIIELSRKKLFLLVIGACAFVAAGAWMLSLDAEEIRASRSFTLFYKNPTFVYALGASSILFFGGCGLYGFKKMFDKGPGLVLNSAGFVDNASGVAAGFIPWSEVTGAGVYEIQGQKMLMIIVSDPRKYVERGGALKRMLNKASQRMMGSSIAISSTALKIDFPELLSLFDRYLQKYRAARDEDDAAHES